MRIVQLTPGTGGMFCGNCLRDHALVSALRRMGHDVLMVPLYLPFKTDEVDASDGSKIFFGGINVYLQQKSALFRKAPTWVDRLFDHQALLRLASKFSSSTRPEQLGELTLSMLRGEEGFQAKEVEKLASWLAAQPKPDLLVLSSALLIGLAKRLKETLGCPLVCTLHGEDFFLDGLPEPFRSQSWKVLEARQKDVDLFLSVSHFYAGHIGWRFNLDSAKVRVVYNGIQVKDLQPASEPPGQPTIGYLARLAPEKGLKVLIEAFALLKKRDRIPGLRLEIAGGMTPADEDFVNGLKVDLKRRNMEKETGFHPNLSRSEKAAYLRGLSVLSVPATYPEAFGLYLLEALACAIPVVQPRHAAFPEILELTGGGILFDPPHPGNLADALEKLLANPEQARKLGQEGRQGVLDRFTVDHMARGVLEVCLEAASMEQNPSLAPFPIARNR